MSDYISLDKFLASVNLISIFKNVLNDSVVSKYLKFLDLLNSSSRLNEIFAAYSDFISDLYEKEPNQNLYAHVKYLLHTDENLLSKNPHKVNENIEKTARFELRVFSDLFFFTYLYIGPPLLEKFSEMEDLIYSLPYFNNDGYSCFFFSDILNSYKTNGYGILSCYNAFEYSVSGKLLPIKNIDRITFNDLKNYQYQKDVISKNTLAFLNDKPANNILLYGDRGCGKSSTVKALLNEYSSYNLKLIQISKESFINLPKLYDKLRGFPAKFLLFVDDLSFEENDKDFSTIKAILEGSISSTPENTIMYATTNRIHFIKETFSGRTGNEVHCNDTIDESVSLSDRFGIVLTFSSLTKNEYIDIVSQIAKDKNIEVSDDFIKSSLMFTMQKGIMTPRVARQFVNDYISNIK